jgi:hypothetical protein
MIKQVIALTALTTGLIGLQLGLAPDASAASLKVKVDSFKSGQVIPGKYAFCIPAETGHTAAGGDISPKITWSKGPRGTKSYAIIVTDPDVPTIRDNMNKEGATLPATMPRRTFYHFLLVDIPPKVRSLAEGEASNARVVHGKPATAIKVGMPGLNDYTTATAASEALKGKYYSYDGPCSPWNDEIVHHYHFTVYALSVLKLDLKGDFNGTDAMAAIKDKILAQGEVVGLYSQYPPVIAKLPK